MSQDDAIVYDKEDIKKDFREESKQAEDGKGQKEDKKGSLSSETGRDRGAEVVVVGGKTRERGGVKSGRARVARLRSVYREIQTGQLTFWRLSSLSLCIQIKVLFGLPVLFAGRCRNLRQKSCSRECSRCSVFDGSSKTQAMIIQCSMHL